MWDGSVQGRKIKRLNGSCFMDSQVAYYSPTLVENKFKVFFNFLETVFWLEPIGNNCNGSSLATELTNISDYILLVYQTALF